MHAWLRIPVTKSTGFETAPLLKPKCRRSWYSFTIITPKLTHIVYHNALCSKKLDDVINISSYNDQQTPLLTNASKTETQRQASNGQGHRWVLADISNTSIGNAHNGAQWSLQSPNISLKWEIEHQAAFTIIGPKVWAKRQKLWSTCTALRIMYERIQISVYHGISWYIYFTILSHHSQC